MAQSACIQHYNVCQQHTEVTVEYTFVLQKQGTHNTQQEYTVPILASPLCLIRGFSNALLLGELLYPQCK